MENTWTMDDAKTDFTAIADAVYAGQPQYITNHSHPDLVITTKNRFEQTKNNEKEEDMAFVDFLLSAPQGDWEQDQDKDALKMRDLDS